MRLSVLVAAVGLSVVGLVLADESHASIKQSTYIPPQPLGAALQTLAKDRGFQVVYESAEINPLQTKGATGELTAEEALTQLLSGTGMTYKFYDANAVSILPVNAKTARQARTDSTTSEAPGADNTKGMKKDASNSFRLAQTSEGAPENDSSVDKQKENEPVSQKNPVVLEEITVTGTNIRGADPVGSSLKSYTREDIDHSGAGTVDQFARAMVENFAGADTIANPNSNAGRAVFSQSTNFNQFGGASFNLYGIGPSSTLTLLNGHRLAPAGTDGSLTDISLIPFNVIDHIEVLSDGASAIYGADAVAGVVNIVTRADFDGAESSVRYGQATDGGASETTASQLLGHSWDSGNVLLSYEYDDQGGLNASQRDFIPPQGGPDMLIPENRRDSAMLSGRQNLPDDMALSGSGLYSKRNFLDQNTVAGTTQLNRDLFSGDATQYGGAATLDKNFLTDWHASLGGSYYKTEQVNYDDTVDTTGTRTSSSFGTIDADADVLDIDLLTSGSVFTLPAGAVKLGAGASYREEGFDSNKTLAQAGVTRQTGGVAQLRRHVRSAYGELLLPIVGEGNAMPWTHRLQLSVSGRFDDYSDFGSTSHPKVGLLWEPVRSVGLRGSYGTSFRAPQLSELASAQVYEAVPFPNPASPTGVTDTLFLTGGNRDLHPETSRSFTAGLDFKPEDLPGLKLSATYFNIDFNNRIETAPITGAFFTPILAPFNTLNPPLATAQSYFNSPYFSGDFAGGGAAAVRDILDDRYTNIASTNESGLNFTGADSFVVPYGTINASFDVQRLLQDKFQSVSTAPTVSLLNTFGEPPRLKARVGLSWQAAGVTAGTYVNYVGSYDNNLFTPVERIGSWTTGDLFVTYSPGVTSPQSIAKGLLISLSVQNVLNQRPPYLQIPAADLDAGQNAIPYDATNASPVGRLVALTLKQRW